MDEAIERIRKRVFECVEPDRDLEDNELYTYIDEAILQENKSSIISMSQREKYRIEIFNSMKRLDILQELLDDNSITEIMINGYRNIFVERFGKISKWEKEFQSKEKLEDIAQKIAGKSNRIVNESTPIVDTRLGDGSRVNIVLSPVAIEGPVITIRKFYKMPITIDKLIELKSVTKDVATFLENVVKAKYNIFVSGGTGSGKTTFLNALSNFIPDDERVITIEDSAELQINGVSNLVRLEARNANVEGSNAITIRELIRSSLRMRPDRILVGEVRGEEAIDMLQAMNSACIKIPSKVNYCINTTNPYYIGFVSKKRSTYIA
ncbi:CpaF family protein [[Clostridium] fimetarium]|uniref:Pilus assembly protein CpaF n=1 Tax=[Clostridium] fimetarium TaxID=99656 RepID=A0A1I0RDW5_9FIRM|nr:ATPase, T2SS/T4P/T4SS family [[Clostridium] fimetarium]SEW39047.1 pilus assembly protein CpaF [[Clostridium] fimetarium]